MELDFDKEIDALLRTMPKSDADFAGKDAHLDADEISAFAENALPEKAKQRYAAHLADCDSCRKNLSELIILNAENEVETVPQKEEIIAAAPALIPWYRKLFAFPNLAYTMGALVIAFAGLTAFIVLQNFNAGNSELAQADTNANMTANVPFEREPLMTENSNAAIAESESFANTNMAANTAIAAPESSPEVLENNQVESKSQRITDLPLQARKVDELRVKSDLDAAKPSDENRQADGAALNQPVDNEVIRNNSADSTIAAETRPAPAMTARRNETLAKKETGLDDKIEKDKAQEVIKSKTLRSGSSRRVSGKTFNRKDGVWYDSAYRNQQTTNVRRGTNEYRNLDSGLRSIAENLSGVVVLVWKEKAYRIE